MGAPLLFMCLAILLCHLTFSFLSLSDFFFLYIHSFDTASSYCHSALVRHGSRINGAIELDAVASGFQLHVPCNSHPMSFGLILGSATKLPITLQLNDERRLNPMGENASWRYPPPRMPMRGRTPIRLYNQLRFRRTHSQDKTKSCPTASFCHVLLDKCPVNCSACSSLGLPYEKSLWET